MTDGPLPVPLTGFPGTATETSLTLDATCTEHDYQHTLRLLGRIGRAAMWWLGDALLFGEMRLGEKAAQFADASGYAPGTLANAMWVARAIPPSRRREGLSWGHHAAVASLEPAHQETLLTRAWIAHDPLTVKELREQVRAVTGKTLDTGRTTLMIADELAQAALDYAHGWAQAASTPGMDGPEAEALLALVEEYRIRRGT